MGTNAFGTCVIWLYDIQPGFGMTHIGATPGAPYWGVEGWFDCYLCDDPVSSAANHVVGCMPDEQTTWLAHDVNFVIKDWTTTECRLVRTVVRIRAGIPAVACNGAFTPSLTVTNTFDTCTGGSAVDTHFWAHLPDAWQEVTCENGPQRVHWAVNMRIQHDLTIMDEDTSCYWIDQCQVSCASGYEYP